MASERGASLAIRTVLVTTRSAVQFNITVGRHETAREAARRGLRLLDDVAGIVAASTEDGVGEQLAAARAELKELSQPGATNGVGERPRETATPR